MTQHADYIVVRPAPDLPAGFLPEHLDGKWYDVNDVPIGPPAGHARSVTVGEAVAVPSGRFEVRDDGAVAEVYEVRP